MTNETLERAKKIMDRRETINISLKLINDFVKENIETVERAKKIMDRRETINTSLKLINDFINDAHIVLSNTHASDADNKVLATSSQMSMSIHCAKVLYGTPFTHGLKVPMDIDTMLCILEKHKTDLEHELLELDVKFKKIIKGENE